MRVLTFLASLSHMSPLAMRRSRDRPRLLGLYLLSPTGLAAVRVERPGFSEDPASLAMMLGIVAGFMGDALCKGAPREFVQILRAAVGDRGFCAVPATNFTLIAVHEGRETRGFLDSLKALAFKLEGRVGPALREWDGNRAALGPAETMIRDFIGRGAGMPEAATRGGRTAALGTSSFASP